VCCCVFSILTDTLTKRILQLHSEEHLTLTVTMFHFGMSALAGLLVLPTLAAARDRHRPTRAIRSSLSVSVTEALAILPIVLCQLGGFLATNLSLDFVPISFTHTVKSCECLFTAALTLLVLGKRLPLPAYLALLPTASGVALSAFSEAKVHFSPAGFLAAMSSNLFFATRSVLSAQLFSTHSVDATKLYWLLECGATVCLATPFLLSDQIRALSAPGRGPLLTSLCICGGCHFAYNMLSFVILQRTSPITHVVLHALRRIILIATTSVLMGNRISRLSWLGVGTATAGVLAYSFSQ